MSVVDFEHEDTETRGIKSTAKHSPLVTFRIPTALVPALRDLVLGDQLSHDDLDTIVRTALAWERKIAAEDPSAYWAA